MFFSFVRSPCYQHTHQVHTLLPPETKHVWNKWHHSIQNQHPSNTYPWHEELSSPWRINEVRQNFRILHTLTQIPHPMHSSSEMKATLEPEDTSIHNFPESHTTPTHRWQPEPQPRPEPRLEPRPRPQPETDTEPEPNRRIPLFEPLFCCIVFQFCGSGADVKARYPNRFAAAPESQSGSESEAESESTSTAALRLSSHWVSNDDDVMTTRERWSLM